MNIENTPEFMEFCEFCETMMVKALGWTDHGLSEDEFSEIGRWRSDIERKRNAMLDAASRHLPFFVGRDLHDVSRQIVYQTDEYANSMTKFYVKLSANQKEETTREFAKSIKEGLERLHICLKQS